MLKRIHKGRIKDMFDYMLKGARRRNSSNLFIHDHSREISLEGQLHRKILYLTESNIQDIYIVYTKPYFII